MEKLVRDAATIMLPPIGNEASWMRTATAVRRMNEVTPLCPLPPDDGHPERRLPFASPG
jgi:hypothetical protein